jgi:hypothetical protein
MCRAQYSGCSVGVGASFPSTVTDNDVDTRLLAGEYSQGRSSRDSSFNFGSCTCK